MAVIQQLFLHSLYFSGALFFLVVLISIFSSSGITSNLKKLTQATSEVAQGNFGIKIHVKSSDEVGVLSKSFNLMTEKISLLMSETEEKVRMESELKTAQAVQNTLFPEASASWEDFTLHGFYQSASECGGDWWYHHRIEDRVYIWVGDATGHGAAAALITSAARAAASLVEWQPNIGPGQALRILNRAIYSTSKGGMMMTFFVGCFDISEGKLYYSNASHNPPFLLKNPRSKDSLSKADFEPLIEANNPRLGQGEDFFFEEASIDVGPGDCVVFYSDGITELKNTEHRDYGERKFLKSLSKNFVEGQNVKEIVEKVVKDAYDYRNDHPLEDDVTLVIAEFKPDEGSKEEAA